MQRILSIFPQSYCTFEVILLARMLYFLLFSIIASISITYVLNDDKERVRLANEMNVNQAKMCAMAKSLHEAHEEKLPMNLSKELEMQPYKNAKAKALHNMNLEIASIVSGKSKDELVDKAKSPTAKWKKSIGLVIPVLLFARWAYTKYSRADGAAEQIVDEHEL